MKGRDKLSLIGPDRSLPIWSNYQIEISDLSVPIYKQVKCYPTDIIKPDNKIPYGFYDKDDLPIKDTIHMRGHKSNDFDFIENPHKSIDFPDKIEGKSLYLGWLFSHYGHFITESLSRLWPLSDIDLADYECFLFNIKKHKKNDIYRSRFIWKILDKLGIKKEKVVLIDQGYEIDELHVPSQALILRGSISKEMKAVWRHVSNPNPRPKLNVYISREEITKRRLFNESALQEALLMKGFKVISPQKMDFDDQLEIFANTKLLVSPSGTGLHNSVFMPDGSNIISITNNKFFLINELLCCFATDTNYSVYQTNPINSNGQWKIDVDDFISHL